MTNSADANSADITLTQRDSGAARAGEKESREAEWLDEFRAQCERNLERSVAERMRYGFCYVYKPVLDDAEWRSFASTAEYRRWCADNLPVYLGYSAPDARQARVLDEGQ